MGAFRRGIFVLVLLTFQQKTDLKRERVRKMLADYNGCDVLERVSGSQKSRYCAVS
jgi:hypothetical protein